MEYGVKAIFYEYKYYLLPEEVSFETLREGGTFSLKRLKEEGCMAPDFIYESIADEELAIEEPARLFPVDVNLYTGKEYDEILAKHVHKVCPGCENYEDDGTPSLEGHHREMGLDGVCYERIEPDEPWDTSTVIAAFWYQMSKKLDALSLFIDAGDGKKLEKETKALKEKFGLLPVKIYGGVSDGKYCLGFAPDYNHARMVRTLAAFYAAVAAQTEELTEAGWVVFSCRKKGVYRYTGKTKMKNLRIRLLEEEGQELSLQVLFRKPPKEAEQERVFQDVYDYICAELGEEEAFAVLYSFACATDEAGREFLSVDEAVQKIAARYAEIYEGEEASYPPMGFFNANGDRAADLPYRSNVLQVGTACPDASLLDEDSLSQAWWLRFFDFCYLYVPRSVDDVYETLGWYLTNTELIPEPLRNLDDQRATGCSVGLAIGEDCYCIDMLVASEKRYLRVLRTIAPVTKALGVKLITVKEDGVMAYDLGYTFTPVEPNGGKYDE